MVSIMNEYVSTIKLSTDDVTKSILEVALIEYSNIERKSILVKANHYIVDIKLKMFSIESAVAVMNHFMEKTRFHYSAYFIRFNEGNLIRYRYATCRENREGFYCDVVIR